MNVLLYSFTLHNFIVRVYHVVRCVRPCNGALCCMTVTQADCIGKDVLKKPCDVNRTTVSINLLCLNCVILLEHLKTYISGA
jgi:hypothetical protein